MSEIDSLRRAVENLVARVGRLEDQNRFTTASDWMPANWWGRISPTLPASRIVNVRGGTFYIWTSDPFGGSTGEIRFLGDTVYDFSDASAFTVSGGYRWCVLRIDVSPTTPTLALYEDGDEYTTAADCESGFNADAPSAGLFTDYLPVAAFVLGNDGNTGIVGAVENVTLADRDQSYVLRQDLFPWKHVHYQGGC